MKQTSHEDAYCNSCAHSSDSDGKDIWVADGDRVKGKWVEILADRTTHKYSGRAEISFDLKVSGDHFAGTGSAKLFDVHDTLTEGPTRPGPMEGKRVTLP